MATRPQVSPNKRPIFHYTDTVGLVGIIGNHEIWATHTDFLNDSLEMEIGIDAIRRSVTDEAQRVKEINVDEKYQNAAAQLELVAKAVERSNFGDTFVASFSKLRDSLPQWRSYAPAGFAIEIDGSDLIDWSRAIRADGKPIFPTGDYLFDVEYAGESPSTLITQAVSELSGSLLSGATTAVDQQSARFQAGAHFGGIYPLLKHGSFREENEVRVVMRHGKFPLEFRPSTLMGPVAFIRIPINPHSIRRVHVGPGPNREIRAKAAEYLLHEKVEFATEIVTSASSYRG